jgi:hypothetical protein
MAWPIIAIHASALPDGRVMTYGTNQDGKQTGKFFYDVWQPFAGNGTGAASHLTLANQTGTDLFCSAQLVLPQSGDLLINGGDIYDAAIDGTLNQANDNVTVFKLASNNLVPAGKMHRPRWYGTATTLPSGETYIQGGSGGYDRAEVRGLDGNFKLLTGFWTSDIEAAYPRNFVGTDGKIFGLAYSNMYRIDPSANGGTGSRTDLGTIPNTGADWTSGQVMYQPGRILQVGGTDNKATIIDIRGAAPAVRSAGTMAYVRAWPGVTVLADGKVAVTGGSASANTTKGVPTRWSCSIRRRTPGPPAPQHSACGCTTRRPSCSPTAPF